MTVSGHSPIPDKHNIPAYKQGIFIEQQTKPNTQANRILSLYLCGSESIIM